MAGIPLPNRGRRHILPRLADAVEIEDADGEEDPAQEAAIEGEVLIAELAGPGRWSQAAFPQWFIHNFFHVLPDTGDVLRLFPVTEENGLGEVEEHRCGHKPGSGNWYFELGLAVAIGQYSPAPNRPIGVFHRIAHQTCRYTVLLPANNSYAFVSNFLTENRNRLNQTRGRLARTIVPAVELRNAWPVYWFFDE